MKVKCPNCATTYTLAPDKIKPGGFKLRCTQCNTLFLVRPKGSSAAPAAPGPSPKLDEGGGTDDLDQFFGGQSTPNTLSGLQPSGPDLGGSDALDSFFGADDTGSRDDDLFAGGDDLFTGTSGDDLFAPSRQTATAAADGDSDDLFGDAADLFAEPEAPRQTAASSSPAPRDNVDATIDDLFGDSEDAGNASLASPSTALKDASATEDTVIGFDQGAIPDFDWDDEDDAGAAVNFDPGLGAEDAQRVLRETIQTELPRSPRRAQRRRGSLFGVLLLLALAGLVAAYVMMPQVFAPLVAPLKARIAAWSAPPPPPPTPIRVVGTPTLSLVQNRAGIALLVVSGELVNADTVPHSFVRLRVDLLRGTEPVTSASVYAGNRLGSIQLKNLPPQELVGKLQVEMGDSLANFNIEPGANVGYMAIFAPAPEGALDLTARIEVLSSYRGLR